MKKSIAIVNIDKCKPKKCDKQCKTNCPVNAGGKHCVTVGKKDKHANISEEFCIGSKCNICTKKCPFDAIKIINLPEHLSEKDTSHRYSANSFKLYKLPNPRLGQVLGLVGTNGIGKSTALKILGGKMKPNLGEISPENPWDSKGKGIRLEYELDWSEIIGHFRGSELQNYFTKLARKQLKCIFKPQYVDYIQKMFKDKSIEEASIKFLLDKKSERGEDKFNEIIDLLDLRLLYNEERHIKVLSGGEMQRFCIAMSCIQKADVYIFDEPSSFLDVKQRLKAAQCIRSLVEGGNNDDDGSKRYVICVEHDLALLDYLSDYICCLYGKAGGYGVVTVPYSVREGINIFLKGYLPAENMRFRDQELSFKISAYSDESSSSSKTRGVITYPNMTKTLGNFKINIESGSFSQSEIIVLLGQNGTGKTTTIKMLAGMKGYENEHSENEHSENEHSSHIFTNISHKPQTINPKFEGTVRELLYKKIKDSYMNQQYQTDVFKPLQIEALLDLNVKELSGGELQRVAIALCLGKKADVYLIDEPSSYLDAEQRINAAKVIKRFIIHSKKTAFVVEHDFIMATYIADRVIYYDGIPSKDCIAHSPQNVKDGMNAFLKQLNVTFRRDSSNWRPRINKLNSTKDVEQKSNGNYFFLD